MGCGIRDGGYYRRRPGAIGTKWNCSYVWAWYWSPQMLLKCLQLSCKSLIGLSLSQHPMEPLVVWRMGREECREGVWVNEVPRGKWVHTIQTYRCKQYTGTIMGGVSNCICCFWQTSDLVLGCLPVLSVISHSWSSHCLPVSCLQKLVYVRIGSSLTALPWYIFPLSLGTPFLQIFTHAEIAHRPGIWTWY